MTKNYLSLHHSHKKYHRNLSIYHNNNNLTCKAPVCDKKRLQWRWRTELVAEVKCLTENVCLQPGFKHSQ